MIKPLITLIVTSMLLGTSIAHADEYKEPSLLNFDSYISQQKATVKLKLVATKGDSLRETLDNWAKSAGWQPLIWNLPENVDYTLGASASFNGDFPSIISEFVDALGADAKFKVLINSSNNVISIETEEQL